jgi:prepilin-type N-terminal cleavage/methylation domain-containing protein
MFQPPDDNMDERSILTLEPTPNCGPSEGCRDLCAPRCEIPAAKSPVNGMVVAAIPQGERGETSFPNSRYGRSGFTLVELLISMTIASLLSVVLGGLIVAVNAAWKHTRNLEDATLQAQAAIERIKYMVSHAGVYQVPGRPTHVGMAVVSHDWFFLEMPDILVIWSGGREGGMAAQGVQNQMPRVNELVIYAADPTVATRLVEITIPEDSSEIDFEGTDFSDTIKTLIESPDAQSTLLSDRVRTTEFPGFATSTSIAVGNIRFELMQTPSNETLEGVAANTDEWRNLPWCQGIATVQTGLRHARLRVELQLESETAAEKSNLTANYSESKDPDKTTSIPYFGSASYRYAYRR